MDTKAAFKELLNSKKVPTNLRSQWTYRLERNKLTVDKIHEALLAYGYDIRKPSKWESPDDSYVRPTCDSFVQLLLTTKIPPAKKKLWKNRMANRQISLNKVEEILTDNDYKKVEKTQWANFLTFTEDQQIVPGEDIITVQNQTDAVWLEEGIYHTLLKGTAYKDDLEKALKREKLFDQLNSASTRKPIIIDSSSLISQSKEAQSYYAHFDRREKFTSMAIMANSPKSIYFSNFFKEINGPNIPTKVFHDYGEAKAWSKEFIITAPDDAFQLDMSKFWIDNGLMHHQFHCETQTMASVEKDLETAKNIKFDGSPQPIIIDYRSVTKMDKKVQKFYLKHPELINGYAAYAMICDHPTNDAIIQFYIENPEFKVPTKIFRHYSEAIHWAKQFLQK